VLPLDRPRLVVVLGCTVGAGQTVTALMLADLLAGLRAEPVAALDLNPGPASLTVLAGVPALTVSALLADRPPGAHAVHRGTAGPARGDRARSRLDVICQDAGADGGAAIPGLQFDRLAGILASRYTLTLADPGAPSVAKLLVEAGQLVLVAQASPDAARAVSMTCEWLSGHGHAALAKHSIAVLNGVSQRSVRHAEQAELVLRGRCRAIVRVPWDDHLAEPEAERDIRDSLEAVDGQARLTRLRPAVLQAYTALAGVLVSSLADDPARRARRQRDSFQARTEISMTQGKDHVRRLGRTNGNQRSGGNRDGGIRRRIPPGMAAPQEPLGALADSYDIPTATLCRHGGLWFFVGGGLLISAAAIGRHIYYIITENRSYMLLMSVWTLGLLYMAAQWLLSWRDRPWEASWIQQPQLDRLVVVVNIPLYNEDPPLLDRCLWALVHQTRPPQVIHVVDDGSTTDYGALRAHWMGQHGITEVIWSRQRNAGKKYAQVATFQAFPEADIFVTIDSDTCLEHCALDEGLKPFANREVTSVAGVALAINSGVNWLTRTVSARDLFFQLVARGAQSSFGDVLVNSGAFALYRTSVIRRAIPGYVGETFFGHRIKLGDDAALTLFARSCGRSVQQSSAFAYTVNPEKLSHHFRQWIRWMRGAAIRNCWRIRYLPLRSWGWLTTAFGIYSFLAALALPVLIGLLWPTSARFADYALIAMMGWSYLTGLRVTAVHRSDETWVYRMGTWLSYLPGAIWGLLVLRPLRLYGLLTCLKQGWTTRADGAEIALTPATVPAAARIKEVV
jgi:hyaluronan synthase